MPLPTTQTARPGGVAGRAWVSLLCGRARSADQPALDEFLGNLDDIRRRTLAEVVGDAPEVDRVGLSEVIADAPHER